MAPTRHATMAATKPREMTPRHVQPDSSETEDEERPRFRARPPTRQSPTVQTTSTAPTTRQLQGGMARPPRNWTKNEVALLKRSFAECACKQPAATWSDVVAMFIAKATRIQPSVNRTPRSVRQKAVSLGLTLPKDGATAVKRETKRARTIHEQVEELLAFVPTPHVRGFEVPAPRVPRSTERTQPPVVIAQEITAVAASHKEGETKNVDDAPTDATAEPRRAPVAVKCESARESQDGDDEDDEMETVAAGAAAAAVKVMRRMGKRKPSRCCCGGAY